MSFLNSVVNADGHISDLATASRALQRALSPSSQTIIKYAKAYVKSRQKKIEILNTALTITRSVPKTVVGQPDRLHTNGKKVVLGPWRHGSFDPMAFAAGRATIEDTPSSFEIW